jgi:F-type H+-transporting ATPase subunit b
MDLFKLDPGLAIWTWVSFAILFFLLSRFLFPSLMRSINERERRIAAAVDHAAEIEGRLAAIQAERETVLKQAQAEAAEIVRKARADAENLRHSLIAQAEAEAQGVIDQSRQKIAEERQLMVNSLRHELAAFVCDSAETVVGTAFVGEAERSWARERAGQL